MKKILFLTNSEVLQNLVTKNQNYEFEFVNNQENLNKILQERSAAFSLLILDETIFETNSALPTIFLRKPIHLTELFGKIEDLLSNQEKKIFNLGNCTINLEARFIKNDKEEIKLTELEAKILDFFLDDNSGDKNKIRILQEVWNYKNRDQMTDTGIVEVTINKLRKKLKDLGIEQLVNFKLS